MSIRIATAPVSWGIMEVEGRGGQKFYGEVLDEMVQAGYDGTELGPYGFMPTEPEELKAELAARSLQLVSAFVPIPLAAPERYQTSFEETLTVADLLAQSGARLIVLADAMSEARMAVAGRVNEERDGLTDEQWEAAADMLSRTARACAERGLRAVFHHHAGTFVETPKEIERLLAMTDADLIGLCLDTGHYFYGGGDPVEAVKKYSARIRHLHLKDVQPSILETVRQESVGFLEAVRRGVFCELGEGAVGFSQVIQGLQAVNYEGWAVVEQDVDITQPGVEPLQSARRSRVYLRSVIGL
jgi:inosose dehydratase